MNQNWQKRTIDDLADVKGGKRLPKGTSFSKSPTNFPYIRIADFSNGTVDLENIQYINPEIQHEIRNYTISKEDVYISIAGTIGLVGTVPTELDDANLTENAAKLVIKNVNELHRDFFALFLCSQFVQEQIKNQTVKTSQPKLALARIKQIKVFLPPIQEQKAIAQVLRAVQQAKATRQKELTLERERKAALMDHLFTHGTRNEPRKQTEIGEIPESWEVKEIKEIATITSGGTPSREKPEYWNGDIPWVKTGEINYNIIYDTEEKITEDGLSHSAAKIIGAGTILMAMYGQGVTRGRVAILGIDASLNQACAAFTHLKDVTNEFLFYFLAHQYEKIRNYGHGANQKNLNSDLIKRFKVAFPTSEDEQNEISGLFKACDSKITALEKEVQHLDELFQALLEELMTGRILVSPLLEPAKELVAV